MKREATAATAAGLLVQIVNSVLSYFERANASAQESAERLHAAAQTAASGEAYRALIAQMVTALEGCR